jgi:hypothetical protein
MSLTSTKFEISEHFRQNTRLTEAVWVMKIWGSVVEDPMCGVTQDALP